MVNLAFLGHIVFATAIYCGVKFCRNRDHKATISASWCRLGGIYMRRREALVELVAHMDEYAIHYNKTVELGYDKKAAIDSIGNIDRAMTEIKQVQEQGYSVKADASELAEQVLRAKQEQELWLRVIENLHERWPADLVIAEVPYTVSKT